MTLVERIHRLLNPHCPDCREKDTESEICKSCEILKSQLDIANHEKKQLLEALLESHKPARDESIKPDIDYKALQKSSMPWAVRKQMLEAESREAARLMANTRISDTPEDKTIEELEKQLGIEH